MRSLWISAAAAAILTFGWHALDPDTAHGDSTKGESAPPKSTTEQQPEPPKKPEKPARSPEQASKVGIDWLVAVQGQNGGWGQDGGETSFVREGENLETNGNDVANTAVATLALLRAGYTPSSGFWGCWSLPHGRRIRPSPSLGGPFPRRG